MSRASISIDVDLDEFDDDSMIDHLCYVLKNGREADKKGIYQQFAESGFPINSMDNNGIVTIRDQQYLEIFEKLKEKYSVWELQNILDGVFDF